MNRRAFTLIEVLAVAVILIVLVAIAIPAFTNMIKSSNRARAENSLRLAIDAARDAAIRSIDGGDAAAVFRFEPGGSLSIVIGTAAGEYAPSTALSAGDGTPRDIFVADSTVPVFNLPTNYLVRGLATPSTIGNFGTGFSNYADWYENYAAGDRYDEEDLNWVLPETGFFDPTKGDEGAKRQTFMIRFAAGTGAVAVENSDEGLFFDPPPFRTRDDYHTSGIWSSTDFRPDLSDDHRRLVRRALFDSSLSPADRDELIGDQATDTVLVRSVAQIGLYDVRDLAAELRARGVSGFRGVDARTGSLYSSSGDGLIEPTFEYAEAVNEVFPSVAKLFVAERYSGSLLTIPSAEDPN
ncbi:MAG: type II secretion system protein [Phycisphaerales bacterium JB037]